MLMVALKCPSCGAACEIDENREFAFCQYCGTKMINEQARTEVFGTVSIDTRKAIENLMERAEAFEDAGDNSRALEYFNRVLDIDAGNVEAAAGERRARGIVDFDNVVVLVGSSYKGSGKIHVIIDGKDRNVLAAGEEAAFSCNVGSHEIVCFTALSNECKSTFEIESAYSEKRVFIEKGILGLRARIENV